MNDPAKIILILCLILGSGGAGYYLRVHDEESKPIVIQNIKQADQIKHLRRFQAAAAAVASAENLKTGMDTAIYVHLIQNLMHPCPLPDEQLQTQCRKILGFARSIEVDTTSVLIKL